MIINMKIVDFSIIRLFTSSCPPPKTCGNKSPMPPAKTNGTMGLACAESHFCLAYKS